jgi:hypothetical protein
MLPKLLGLLVFAPDVLETFDFEELFSSTTGILRSCASLSRSEFGLPPATTKSTVLDNDVASVAPSCSARCCGLSAKMPVKRMVFPAKGPVFEVSVMA